MITNEPIVGLCPIPNDSGMYELEKTSDGRFRVGENGVKIVISTGDGKVEFVSFDTHTLGCVKSALGYSVYYPIYDVKIEKPIKAVLMDLDGTTVKSEQFWISIIEKTTSSLLGDSKFSFEEQDLLHVSGHSVAEHLQYCIEKYCPEKTLEEAREWYFKHTRYELNEITKGRRKGGLFKPSHGIKDFLLALRDLGVKIGLVTSGLYEKAWPEIVSAFRTLDLGKPEDFYSASITAGFTFRNGLPGTLGELPAKPHPWLYAETALIGLGIPFKERHHVIGVEDSGAGVCSLRLAGFSTIGIHGGNIVPSGTKALCSYYCETFEEILSIIK